MPPRLTSFPNRARSSSVSSHPWEGEKRMAEGHPHAPDLLRRPGIHWNKNEDRLALFYIGTVGPVVRRSALPRLAHALGDRG